MARKWPSLLFILLHLALLPYCLSLGSKSTGFSLKLTRRDFDLSGKSTNYFPNTIRPRITRSTYIFTIEANIGTPASKKTFIFDPGSELTWTQCTPCVNCFKKDYPLFDPKYSKSYQKLSPNHTSAKYFRKDSNGDFTFNLLYGSGESASGIVSVETFGFPSSNGKAYESINGVVFGCANYQIGHFRRSVTGIMGLSRSPLSLIGQMGATAKRFSYCLPPGQRLNLLTGTFPTGCMLDAGCGGSVIETRAYNEILRVLLQHFQRFNLTRVSGGLGFLQGELCYRLRRGFRNYPGMTFHFQGANYEIGPENLFRVFDAIASAWR
ncbi:hypothetical protein DH2020_034150 [Rehmannia glutinosa]|uniref:Peptidase A1 domain-containing protein n=1 Tax=Rehmannia glutinosa TaxID=99300 RepID=A0ABR0VA47_REHGL